MDISDQADTEKIAHLDFDPHQEPEEKCEGFRIDSKQVTQYSKDNSHCPNKVKVVAIRSCCGVIQHLCVSCYNEICKFHAQMKKSLESQGGHAGHPVHGIPFSTVDFV